ncbi:tRNA dihydrouridine synthase [Rubinisphaera sp. JC750]|uniref:tRNA dihydrouridine synthase n=1 Tax=Rubinisphaera sp. JC750 TaxID=2898658 RepID=UPI001F1DAFC6|nr:tRNA-dihydrouridine synthase [Rubinisphaera sp. JC750]
MLVRTEENPVETAPKSRSVGLAIGDRQLKTRYFLAPLAGYTHLPLRTALRELGGIGLATTDLILAPQLLADSKKSRILLSTSEADRPLSVQIFGGRTEDLVRAAQRLEERGYEGVDINMGCPMGKVNSSGGGARLMCDCDNATQMTAAVVEAVDIPVTVKMRLGWDADNITAPILARAFEDVGVAAITIHGRTRQQGFHGSVNLEGIRKTVEAVDRIPIIGNGDVRSVDDAIHMRKVTGCDAIAIGRGAMLDPWLFRKLWQHENGLPITEPTRDEQIAFLVRHFELMAEQRGDYACVLFRKFVGWYGARLGIPEDLEDRLRRTETIAEFEQIVTEIRGRHGERRSTTATALIKTPNGPNAHW